MFLFGIIEILCFTTVFATDNIPLTTEKPHSLQRDTLQTDGHDISGDTLQTDGHDISGLFKPSVKSGNASAQILEHRPIALEGGSSVIANDTVISGSITQKGLDENTTWEQTSFDNGAGVKQNNSNNFHQAIQTEGGLLDIPVSTATVGETTKLVPGAATDLIKDSFQLNLGEVSDHPSVVPRKGVSPKIVPRKGAEPYEPFPDLDDNTEMKSACNCCETLSSEPSMGNYSADPKCVSCCNTSDSKIPIISTTGLKNDTMDSKSASNSSYRNNVKSVDKVNVTDIKSETMQNNSNSNDVYRANPPLKRKSKPLVTSDADSEQKQQKIPQPSSANKSDFVIPVVVLILAVPVVIVLAMLFYRKGTEFWERRHYSKMDFLIDGMYNE